MLPRLWITACITRQNGVSVDDADDAQKTGRCGERQTRAFTLVLQAIPRRAMGAPPLIVVLPCNPDVLSFSADNIRDTFWPVALGMRMESPRGMAPWVHLALQAALAARQPKRPSHGRKSNPAGRNDTRGHTAQYRGAAAAGNTLTRHQPLRHLYLRSHP